MSRELKILAAFAGIFLMAYHLPLSNPKMTGAIVEAFKPLRWWARSHTLACVATALFIAGGIAMFLYGEAVPRHPGPKANKLEAHSVPSVSGTVLVVVTATVVGLLYGAIG